MKKIYAIFAAVLIAMCVGSCYKLISVNVPEVVEAGQTFEVSFTVVDDGSNPQSFVTDWSYAGIRVPEGWTVTMPEGAHQQIAEDWVYYQDGSQVASKHNMVANAKLTAFYNEAAGKSGYRWHAFGSEKMIPKNITACWRNGCDSIRVSFLVTIPEGTQPGDYSIDFIGGDEEASEGVNKYASFADVKGSRLLEVSTTDATYANHVNTLLSRTVSVIASESSSIKTTAGVLEESVNIYSAAGQRLSTPRKGINIIGGKTHVVK